MRSLQSMPLCVFCVGEIMRTYRASGIAPLSGVFTALIAGLIGAIIMGGLLYAIVHYAGL